MEGNKYQHGKIYKIVDVGYKKCYIGSTCESLSQRMARHRQKYKSYLKGRAENTRSFFLFDEFGVDNCKIELIENFCCNSKMELLKQEGQHIRNNERVNKLIAGRSNAEYRKIYENENREQIRLKNQEWYKKNKEYRRNYRKEYNANNRNKAHEHYESKKTQLLEKKICECGKTYTYQHKKRHEQSQKHQNYLKQQSQET